MPIAGEVLSPDFRHGSAGADGSVRLYRGRKKMRAVACKQVVFAVKLLVSISLIAFLVSWIDFTKSLALFARADGWLIFLGSCLMVVQTVLSAFKWRILLRGQGIAVPFAKLLKTYLLANFVNLFTPGFIGGDAYRSVSVRAYTGGVARSLSSVLVDRITGFVALLILGAAGLSLHFMTDYAWLLGSAILAAITIGYALLVYAVGPFIDHLTARRTHGVFVLVRDLIAALRPTPTLWLAFAVAFVFQINTIFIIWIWSTGLNLSASIAQLFLIVPVVYMMEILPISISGVGLREGTYALLFASFGLPPEQGVALGLLTSVMRYVVGALGSLVWFLPDAPIRARETEPHYR